MHTSCIMFCTALEDYQEEGVMRVGALLSFVQFCGERVGQGKIYLQIEEGMRFLERLIEGGARVREGTLNWEKNKQ